MHGRHLGEFLGKPPTGKEFAVEHIHIWRIADGQVIEHWSVRDDLGQALQLGLIGG
jgi:predicted ester cyclase